MFPNELPSYFQIQIHVLMYVVCAAGTKARICTRMVLKFKRYATDKAVHVIRNKLICKCRNIHYENYLFILGILMLPGRVSSYSPPSKLLDSGVTEVSRYQRRDIIPVSVLSPDSEPIFLCVSAPRHIRVCVFTEFSD